MAEDNQPDGVSSSYPIGFGWEQRRALVEQCRLDLSSAGACCLRGFIGAEALNALTMEAKDLAVHAYRGLTESSAYYARSGAGYPPEHPLNMKLPTDFRLVAGDLIPARSRLRSLYEATALRRFLADILGRDQLYPMADPYQCLNLSVIHEDGHQHWHFDASDFVVTLMLQPSVAGGEFQYVPRIRTPADENFDHVGRIIQGESMGVESVRLEPGTLMIFQGEFSLHRVAPIRGNLPRLLAILSYHSEPGRLGRHESNVRLYGERVVRYEPGQRD